MRVLIKLGPIMPAWTGPPSIKGMFGGRIEVDDRIVHQLTLHLEHFRYQRRAPFPTAFPAEELQRVQSPILLMVGEREVIYNPRAVLERARSLFPDVETELLAGCGHLIDIKQQSLFDSRVTCFLDAHPPQSPTPRTG